MVFSSNFFLLTFLPLFFAAYFVSPGKLKNVVALAGSIFFYSWGAPDFVFILFASLFIDYYLVQLIYVSNGSLKKWITGFALILNIGLLGYYKYEGFFVENLNVLLSMIGLKPLSITKVLLPIGISFITFHKITYVIDAYRNIHKPLEKFTDYVLYIMMFPHQIAGPIVRFNSIADQLENREANETLDNKLYGLFRFIIGLSKKVIIANPLGEVADHVFNSYVPGISSVAAWIGIVAYTFQIFFDFSGYSDMAIGLARMMGFTFPENFNHPYISKSITELWKRWHITLGAFMRDYLYIPLGGNKVSTGRMFLNLWIVFLISGLWHGASWTFVIWGAYHGLFLILDRLFLLKFYNRTGNLFATIITFFITMMGWVFFRSNTLNDALSFFGKLFSFKGTEILFDIYSNFHLSLILALIFSFAPAFNVTKQLSNIFIRQQKLKLALQGLWLAMLLILCISYINSSDFNPFIYFRF